MQEERRRSTINYKYKSIEAVLGQFTDKHFLTKYSLFNNLLASEQLKLDLASNQLLKTIFGSSMIAERDLYEFSYFHLREKKILLYTFIRYFLINVPKTEIVLFLNSQTIDLQQIQNFMSSEEPQGKKDLWNQFNKRVIIVYINSSNTFIFNLLYLPIMMKERQFIKAVIVCDINAYQSSDKSSLDKYYRKIPKSLTVLTFRKDFFEYKVTVKTALSFLNEGQQELTELNEKVVKYLNRKVQGFNYHFGLMVPFEYVSNTAKTVEQSYKSVVFRLGPNARIQEAIFYAKPFKLEYIRDI